MRASALVARMTGAVIASGLACVASVACTGNGGGRLAAPADPRAASGDAGATASSSTLSPRSDRSDRSVVGDYAAVWDPDAGSVRIEARFTASAGGVFTVDRGADAFAKDVEMSADRDGAPWSAVTRQGREFRAAACAAGPCRLRYRFARRAAARRLDDVDTASEEGEILEAPPSTWLLTPAASRDARLRFRVACPEGQRFVTGVFRSPDVPSAWELTIDDLWTSPYSAFGPLRVHTVQAKGGALEVAIGPGKLAVSEDELVAWVEQSARAVTAYYGRFPIPSALVLLVASRGRWVGSGRTLAGGGGTVFVRIGEVASTKAYRDDWVLVHELIHLTFPSVPRDHDWAEEGIATYAEPFARVRAGLLGEEQAWVGLAEGLPNGQPAANDRGLDRTPTWGRIYWGGALFWFLADVEIRKRTGNRMGLEHALRGVIEAGGNNAVRWSLADVLAAGDRATGVPVLVELHAAMATSPHPVDLEAVMRSLGVVVSNGHARFDDKAPLAAIRRAIAQGNADTMGPR